MYWCQGPDRYVKIVQLPDTKKVHNIHHMIFLSSGQNDRTYPTLKE